MELNDLPYIFASYDFLIGVLLMLASENIGKGLSIVGGPFKQAIQRYSTLAVFTFGAVVALFIGIMEVFFIFMVGGR